MSLTKEKIAGIIQSQNGITKKRSIEIIETLLEIIKNALVNGQDVLISGFGKFSVREKGERRGRNPSTGDDLMLKSRRVARLKWSRRLREKINI